MKKIRRHTWFLIVVGIGSAIVGFAIWKFWTDKSAGVIESISTLVIAVLTIILAYFNWESTNATQDALRQAREAFESEWRPDLRIASVQTANLDAHFTLANLGRSAALVKRVRIGAGSGSNEPQDIAEYPVSCLVKAGEFSPEGALASRLRQYGVEHLPQGGPRGTWQVALNIALLYDCAGKEGIPTPWFRCSVEFTYIRQKTSAYFQQVVVTER